MLQFIFGHTATEVFTGGFQSPNLQNGTSGDYHSKKWRVSAAGTLSNLRVRFRTAPGGMASRTIDLYKGTGAHGAPAASGISITIAGAGVDGQSTNSIAVAVGDTYGFGLAQSGSPASSDISLAYEFTSDVASECIYATPQTRIEDTHGTRYASVFSGTGVHQNSESNAFHVVPCPGTIHFSVQLTQAGNAAVAGSPGTSKSVSFVLRKNFVDQDGSGGTPDTHITISGGGSSGSSGTGLSVVRGDVVSIKVTSSGTPIAVDAGMLVRFVSADDFTHPICAVGTGLDDQGDLGFACMTSQDNPISAGGEDFAYTTGPITDATIDGLIVQLGVAPGSGDARTFTSRLNGLDTALAVTISESDTQGENSIGSNPLTSADTWNERQTFTGLPTPTNGIAWSYRGSAATASPASPASPISPSPGGPLIPGVIGPLVWVHKVTENLS